MRGNLNMYKIKKEHLKIFKELNISDFYMRVIIFNFEIINHKYTYQPLLNAHLKFLDFRACF